MNIVFLSTENPFPVDHGHHIRTYHVLKALAEEHRIFFIGFSQNEAELKFKENLDAFCETADIYMLPFKGWRLAFLAFTNLFSRAPLIAQKYYIEAALKRIMELNNQYGIDLIHYDMLHLAEYHKKLSNFPGILVNHNVESLRLLRWANVEKNVLLKLFLKYQYLKLLHFEKRRCPEFDACAVVSDFDRSFLQDLCQRGHFVVVPNGVDTSYFKVSENPIKETQVVWAGAMTNPYNRDAVLYFIETIWPLIRASIPEASAQFVGKVSNKIRALGEQKRGISFVGYVDDVRSYVDRSAVFIAPLRSGSGTKIKILNAMAQGKPVVTTSVGAEGIDAIPGTEILIADDPESFADKVVFLLRNSKKAKEIGLNARKVIEKKYDWQIINQRIKHLYQSSDRHQKKNLHSPAKM